MLKTGTWPCLEPQMHAPCSAFGVDEHSDLGNVGPGHSPQGFPKAQCLRPRFKTMQKSDMSVHWKELSPRSLKATHISSRAHMFLRKLLFAIVAHQGPIWKSTWSAYLAAKTIILKLSVSGNYKR